MVYRKTIKMMMKVKLFFAMVLNIMYYSGQNLQAVVEFTPEEL